VYVHPRYRELTGREPERSEAAPAPPPEPSGELIACFARKGVRGGPDQELRLVLDEFNGHACISVRLWEKNRAGDWWPVKGKGVSVRLSEAEGVSEALRAALDLAIALDAERGA
jgi:hypothetical protein